MARHATRTLSRRSGKRPVAVTFYDACTNPDAMLLVPDIKFFNVVRQPFLQLIKNGERAPRYGNHHRSASCERNLEFSIVSNGSSNHLNTNNAITIAHFDPVIDTPSPSVPLFQFYGFDAARPHSRCDCVCVWQRSPSLRAIFIRCVGRLPSSFVSSPHTHARSGDIIVIIIENNRLKQTYIKPITLNFPFFVRPACARFRCC